MRFWPLWPGAWRSGAAPGRWRGSNSHGTSRLCSVAELQSASMLGDDSGFSLLLGRVGFALPPTKAQAVRALFSPTIPSERACGAFVSAFSKSQWMANRIIRVKDYVHAAAFSRTGGGKGVSVVIPNLLSYKGSVVCIDIKGENTRLTAEHRRTRMGQAIITIDPFGIGGRGSASLNALHFIDANSPTFLDQCTALTDMLIVSKGTEPDPFWNKASSLVLTGMIAFVCACEPDENQRNLQLVRDIVSSPTAFDSTVAIMRQVDNLVIRRLGEQMSWLVDREKASVLASVGTHTAWMDSPVVAACMNTSSFDPRDLRSGRVTVYLALPPEQLETLRARSCVSGLAPSCGC